MGLNHTDRLDSGHSSMPFALLHKQLSQQLEPAAVAWVENTLIQVATEPDDKSWISAFGQVARKVGKANLRISLIDQRSADSICPGWRIVYWSTDQAARALLLLERLNRNSFDTAQGLLKTLLGSADVAEQIAIYQSLPLLRGAEHYCEIAREGVRSSITAVFNAIALRNPYPARYFDEPAWNQMVLKALFENSPLSWIEGLDQRANPTLARMLTDYAHERWAANRRVDPQLWRSVGPFVEADMVVDLTRLLAQSEPAQQEAAALACEQSSVAQPLLEQRPDLKRRLRSGQLTWDSLGTYAKPNL
jgi:hypothetical protein